MHNVCTHTHYVHRHNMLVSGMSVDYRKENREPRENLLHMNHYVFKQNLQGYSVSKDTLFGFCSTFKVSKTILIKKQRK